MENTTPYENLANAIIISAVRDYKKALRKLNKYPENAAALETKAEVEEFFHSKWFETLTKADPAYIIEKIRAEEVA